MRAKKTLKHICIKLMNTDTHKDPFIQFRRSDGITYWTVANLAPWLCAHTWKLAPEWWCVNFESHLFWKHMNLTPSIAPSIKQSQVIVYRCVWVFFCIALTQPHPQPGELRPAENWDCDTGFSWKTTLLWSYVLVLICAELKIISR